MQGATTSELIARLKDAFPRERVERGTLRVYLDSLADIPAAVLEHAVQSIIQTSPWFPSVAAIREAAAEHVLGLPREAEALAQIEARMRWAREGCQGKAPPVHPLVKRAVQDVGGYFAFRVSDKTHVVRGQFGRLYREMRSQAVSEAQASSLCITSGRNELPTGRSNST